MCCVLNDRLGKIMYDATMVAIDVEATGLSDIDDEVI